MEVVTRIPFSDILLAVCSVSLIIALLWAGFFPKKNNSSSSNTTATKSSNASKPASTGINININGASGNESATGQEPKA